MKFIRNDDEDIMLEVVIIMVGFIAVLNLLGCAPTDLRFDYSDIPANER